MSRPPTKAELAAAYGATIPDLISPGLRVLLVGINPSLYSAAVGQHFARPGNRLWPTLHAAGCTDRRLHPSEQDALLDAGIGVTNLVVRATARADELGRDELQAGLRPLTALVERWQPRWVAFLGLTAYRVAFAEPAAQVGRQARSLGPAGVWLLPNPSGLNAHYQLADLAAAYAQLQAAATTLPIR